MAERRSLCRCPSGLFHGAFCELVNSGVAALPEKLPTGVVVEALHLEGIGAVYLSDCGGIRCMTPDEARGLAKALLLKAGEAAREEVLDAA